MHRHVVPFLTNMKTRNVDPDIKMPPLNIIGSAAHEVKYTQLLVLSRADIFQAARETRPAYENGRTEK